MATRSQRINPWIDSLDQTSATICKMAEGYQALSTDADLAEAEIRESWQMAKVLVGKLPKTHFGLVRLDANRPSPTIQKDAGNTTTGLCHPVEIRRLTIPEIKRLASFPDGYQLEGAYKDKWARIGNSVPPLFMRSIAGHIRREILSKVVSEVERGGQQA